MVATDATPDEATKPTRLRVVVADDNALLREGIAALLEGAGHEVVGRSGDADDLLLKVRSYSPDIAIVDVRMPPGTPTTAWSRQPGSGGRTPRWQCSCSPSTSSRRTCSSSWATTRRASATS